LRILHREGGGGDHFRVSWKTPFATDTAFQLITSQYVFDYTCNLDCPDKGIACDDNDPTTVNDVQDGYCNCFGTPQPRNTPNCIGDKGYVNVLYYDSIYGERLTNLYFNANYPLAPSRGGKIEQLSIPSFDPDSIGTVIKGYLSVPVTGTYYFNITGRRRAAFKLSATENPEEAVFVSFFDLTSSTNAYEHDREVTQTSQGQVLEKGKFYYFEINHVGRSNNNWLYLFWKTPFYPDDRWREIDGAYFYQYSTDCEFPCYPKGTPCNDGSSLTTRDTFNANCLCVGIPCPDGDCGEAKETTVFEPTETCGVAEGLDNEGTNSWLSCTDAVSPVTGIAGKWIQYDLGQIYYIDKAQIWNYNVVNQTGQGFKSGTIHASNDGVNWSSLGSFSWSEASGLVGYEGFAQNIEITGRYLHFSADSNFDGGDCFGLSKVNFVVFDCLNVGQPCDDGLATTSNDVYNKYCQCEGTTSTVDNFCRRENRIHANVPIDTDNYDAKKTITSEAILLPDYDVSYIAGESISLLPGFHAQQGSKLLAAIDVCPDETEDIEALLAGTIIRPYDVGDLYDFPPKNNDTTIIDPTGTGTRLVLGTPQNLLTILTVSPNPTKDWATLNFTIPATTRVSLKIFAVNGQEIATLINNQVYETGGYQESFNAQNLAKGIYLINLTTEATVITKNLAVIE